MAKPPRPLPKSRAGARTVGAARNQRMWSTAAGAERRYVVLKTSSK